MSIPPKLLLLCMFGSGLAISNEQATWTERGYAGISSRLWETAKAGRESDNAGLRLGLELTRQDDHGQIVLAPRLTAEEPGTRRSRIEIDELSIDRQLQDSYFKAGIYRVSWGATESRHLVDIINPPDYARLYTGEERLATPILQWKQRLPVGLFEVFLLPWERDPIYPGERGRPRTELPVQRSQAHPDGRPLAWASRLSVTNEQLDAHLYYFRGLDREAVLSPILVPGAPPAMLEANRRLIEQWGLDLQVPLGNWMLKGEFIHRTGYSRPFSAGVLGLEYSLMGIGGTSADLSLLSELQYDARPADAPLTPMPHGVFGGVRLNMNDAASSELKIGFLRQSNAPTSIGRLEFTRRIADNWTAEATIHTFHHVEKQAAMAGYAGDNFMQLVIKRHWH